MRVATSGNTRKARERARKAAEPWRRCQELAWVARFAPEGEVAVIAAEALKAAEAAADPYRQVGAAAWPVRALAERGETGKAEQALGKLLKQAESIEPPTSRTDGLFLLLQAAWPLSRRTRSRVLAALAGASQRAGTEKAESVLRDALLMFAQEDAAEARRLAEGMPEGQSKRQALRRLDAGETMEPRPFFWTSSPR